MCQRPQLSDKSSPESIHAKMTKLSALQRKMQTDILVVCGGQEAIPYTSTLTLQTYQPTIIEGVNMYGMPLRTKIMTINFIV